MKTVFACLFLLCPVAAWAQVAVIDPATPEPAETGPRIVRLSLSPAAEPAPALKYELLPPSSQRTPGNAAPYYYRSILWLSEHQKDFDKQYIENEKAWTEGPLDKLDKDQVRKWVEAHRLPLENLKTAVYRETCDFDWRVQDLRGQETIGFLLEEVQRARGLARVLRVKARLEMAEGKLDEALETLRHGYQLGRDVAQPPLLINALVGVAIGRMMNETVIELLDQPGAPNLYWAIAALPRPYIDFRPAMRTELEMPEKLFPFLKDAETAERTPEEWQKLLIAAYSDLQLFDSGVSSGNRWLDQLSAAAILARGYPVAKAELIAAGYDAGKLEKMPVAQVVAIQSARVMRHAYHEIFKCTLLDYPDSAIRLKETNDRLIRERYLGPSLAQKDPLMLTGLLLPAISNVNVASIRSARDLAALQTIEAIRMHLAASGKLPASLDDVAIVPVPKNPATGKPFPYELKEGVATLVVPTLLATDERDATHYVMTADTSK
ncbi:MAG TPA: hypothetical protein VMP01_27790 [Pirellulaceae bacterium]|nr:hypothetical protein [Pirellulaceae bacterium]